MYMYIRFNVCVCVGVYSYTSIHMQMHESCHTYNVCVCVCVYSYTSIHMQYTLNHMHIYIYIYVCILIHINSYAVHIKPYVHIHIYICAYTHTHQFICRPPKRYTPCNKKYATPFRKAPLSAHPCPLRAVIVGMRGGVSQAMSPK